MSLIVEDGTGSNPDANSYVSIEDATAYFEKLGIAEWGYRPDLQEAALINATATLDMTYGTSYRGEMATNDQPLLWGRTAFVDGYGRTVPAQTIPASLAQSTAMLGLEYIKTEGTLIEETTYDSALQSEGVMVGNGAVQENKSYFYAVKEKSSTRKQSDLLIAPLLNGGGSGQVTAQRG